MNAWRGNRIAFCFGYKCKLDACAAGPQCCVQPVDHSILFTVLSTMLVSGVRLLAGLNRTS